MEYEKAVEAICSLKKFGSRPGLDSIKELLDRLDNPQNKLKYIHVAGTNGKGSVCAMTAKILECSEYKTGLYTSPFIVDFRERIQICSEMIPKSELARLVDNTYPVVEELINNGIIITEFEYITALAFLWFEEQKCDIVVLETGLGGRFDATNIINESIVDVITPISLDHTNVLGDTEEKICDEKRHIIKEKSSVVFYRQQPSLNNMIQEYADLKKSRVYFADETGIAPYKQTLKENSFVFRGDVYKLNLLGTHQIKNAAIAFTVINALRKNGFAIPCKAVKKGFAEVAHPGRLEYFDKKIPIVLDGAHNPSGMAVLSDSTKKLLSEKKIICVLGMLSDKDIEGSVSHLKGQLSYVICTEPFNERKQSADKLKRIADSYFDNVIAISNPHNALEKALSIADDNSVILVCGSLYLVSELRAEIIKL
ncbi:MAG: bifunctional folylpolyglutamate synthase/dihydrofolate synthase [Clostridiales bacterium]|nr:bifunctional folylpolyglutamate synthase/dihydrofolate synthase [Clostridiales bacterium]